MEKRDDALEYFACARQAAQVNGQTDPSVVHALTGQALMALQEGNETLLTQTLELASGMAATSENKRFYDRHMANLLQRYGRTSDWKPLEQATLNDGGAPARQRMHAARNLARAARLAGDPAQAASWLKSGLALDACSNNFDAIETRLNLAGALAEAGAASDAQTRFAEADALIKALAKADQPWFSYRAAKARLQAGLLDEAEAGLQAVRTAWPDSREARKALFAMADAAKKRGDPAGEVSRYLEYARLYSLNDKYSIQAAVLALEIMDDDPSSAPGASTVNELTEAVAANTDCDWRCMASTAQYLFRHGQQSQVGALVPKIIAAFDDARNASGAEPLSHDWVALEARLIDILFGFNDFERVVKRIESVDDDKLFAINKPQRDLQQRLNLLLYYIAALRGTNNLDKAVQWQSKAELMMAGMPPATACKLKVQEIYNTWASQSFSAAESKINAFLQKYPASSAVYALRRHYALALIHDEKYQDALDMIQVSMQFNNSTGRAPSFLKII